MLHMIKKAGIFMMSIAIGLLLTVTEIQAQQSTSSKASGTLSTGITVDELKIKRQAIEKMTDLDAALKTDSLKDIDLAIADLDLAAGSLKKIQELSELIKKAPKRLKMLRDELKKTTLAPDKVEEQVQKMDTATLEQRLLEENAQYTNAQTKLQEWNERLSAEKSVAQQTPEQLAVATSRLNEIQAELAKLSDVTESDTRNYARVLSLHSEREKLNAESKLNELRQRSHNLLVELIGMERDVAQKAVQSREQILNIWQTEVQNRRRQEAIQAREDAQDAMINAPLLPKAIQDQFDINIQLSKELERITGEEAILAQKYENYQSRLNALVADFETAKKRVESTALTEAIGLALRNQRLNLPTAKIFDMDSRARQSKITEISEKQINLDQMLRELSTPQLLADRLMGSVDNISDVDLPSIEPKIQQLIANRIEIVEKLKFGYNRIIKLLQDIEFTEQTIVNTANSFGELLDRHLLWIRSSKRLSPSDLLKLRTALGWFFAPKSWHELLQDLSRSLRAHGFIWPVGILIGLMLLLTKRRERRVLREINLRVQQDPLQDSFALTLRALGLTVLLSITWPFILAFPSVLLLNLQKIQPFTRAMANGLLNVAQALVLLNLLYYICRKNGLAQVHFRWAESARQTLMKNLGWIIPIAAVCAFFMAAMETVPEIEYSDALAKSALIVLAAATAVFGARILRFKGGITSVLLQKYPKSWSARLRYVWYPLVVALPLLILVLAVQGYYYSALEIRHLMRFTVVLAFSLIVLNDLVLRFLMLVRRKLALKKARLALQQQKDKKTEIHSGATPPVSDGDPSALMQSTIGMGAIDDQTRTLLKTVIFILALVGLWAIWEPVFSAFGILLNVKLWSYTTVVDGTTQLNTITLANIAIAVIVIAITIIAIRNLPGLFEMILLNRLPMNPGARYAYSTVTRYAVTAIGIVVALNVLGLRWSNLQWLIAALSVGLGFGLQEIVANFVSGLIVLFERPFAVGDTVTVGDIHGTVTRIQIRATTILDWDRKELIVPNKEFITGRLINWSLSDSIIRIKVPVGIEYGSDTDLAEELLLKAAKENPLVLKNPEPKAVFLSFGDNSLNFELRVYIKHIEDWIPMLHAMNRAIDKAFRQAEITIAFPQRDVHLDATSPLEVKVVSEAANAEGTKPSSAASRNPTA